MAILHIHIKLSINISTCIANVATIVYPVGNAMVSGAVVCMVAGSFATSLQLTNDCVVPVSSIADTANLWV